ncbi:FAD-binding oxidoreductase [Pseudoxanthomonas sp. LjRoot143]|uniref:NAD(P)/FAD-dependent oxidoreductase n=1 Tax=Pseudoxanthomonas sp. LjRoot143 TaxID=3342266 RepID=UPI003ECF6A35
MASRNYYAETAGTAPALQVLQSRIEAEICVVGGGFAGLNTALGLAERGVRDVVLVEADTPAFGASGRNGGFVFGGFSRGEASLLRDLGPARANALYTGTTQAVELIRRRITRYGIACDDTQAGIIWANWFDDREVLRQRQALLLDIFGQDWQWMDRDEVRHQLRTTRYHDALYEPQAFHFHPLKYANGLARVAAEQGVSLFARSPAVSLDRTRDGWRVTTPSGSIDARQVVLACGGYLAGLHRRVDAGVLPIATYVMVTAPLGARLEEAMRTRAAVYDTRFAFDYYRPLPDSRLLWGGRISILDRSPHAVRRLLYRDMLKVFPQLEGVGIDYAWSGLMSYARHEMPQIGQVEPGLWVAQAFGGHGVAPTTLAGEVIASAIAEGDGRWREFGAYGLVSAMKPAGFLGAQLSYWWAEAKDAWKARMEQGQRP